jgi:hypothetical protein
LASPHCGSADDYLYVALLVISVQLIVTIKADRHRYVQGWQLAPVTGAAVYERKLFFGEFLFGAASDFKGMAVSMAPFTRKYHGTGRDLCRRMVAR